MYAELVAASAHPMINRKHCLFAGRLLCLSVPELLSACSDAGPVPTAIESDASPVPTAIEPVPAVAPGPTTYRPGERESTGMLGNGMSDNEIGMSDNEVGMSDNEVGMSDNEIGMSGDEFGMSDNEELLLEAPESIATPPLAPTDPNVDDDGDGFSEAQGDCNDKDPQSNPGAYDVLDNEVDEDCDGTPDNEVTNCDEGLSLEADDATEAARALGLCRTQEGDSWGLVAARWVFPNGDALSPESERCEDSFLSPAEAGAQPGSPPHPMSRGILDEFGPAVSPFQGENLVAISSGIARAGQVEAPQPAAGTSPAGASMSCPDLELPEGLVPQSNDCSTVVGEVDSGIYRDGIALELEIKAPTNASAFAFSFDFYTFEYPDYVCSLFNDYFVALLYSQHPAVPANRNISFDREGNHVSVNAAFVEVCESNEIAGKTFDCPFGTAELEGTGFLERPPGGDEFAHAATGWLETLSPIVPGETMKLRLAIWDAGDNLLDSTVLLDNLRWVTAAGEMPEAPVTARPPKIK